MIAKWHRRQVTKTKYLCLAIVASNEECHISRSTNCFGANEYVCYDYFMHLDTLPDISFYQTVVKPQRAAM